MIADAMLFFGADTCYYSRTRKPDAEARGIAYRPMHSLLAEAEIVCTCLPRNNYLLGDEEFSILGNGKILVNTSVGPTFDTTAIKRWLERYPESYYLCDATGMGALETELCTYPNVLYTPMISGKSAQSIERLSQKALDNIRQYMQDGGAR